MSITITAGWWLVPTVITFCAYFAAFMTCRDGGKSGIGDGVVTLVVYAFATIASLASWLGWSLL